MQLWAGNKAQKNKTHIKKSDVIAKINIYLTISHLCIVEVAKKSTRETLNYLLYDISPVE